jgi:hypothetical protein
MNKSGVLGYAALVAFLRNVSLEAPLLVSHLLPPARIFLFDRLGKTL